MSLSLGAIMVDYPVPGLRCMFCSYRVKQAIRKIDPNLKVRIDLRTGWVRLGNEEDIRTLERALAYLKELAPVF